MIKDLLSYLYQITYDIMSHRDEYSNDEYNESANKVFSVREFYKELIGEEFIFEVPCTRYQINIHNNIL